ncbi:MAG: 50S ribosomal protein L3 [Candidatus Woesearchaeota archaeon]|nr:MAG: 50S ribosomal protein L3 [Candidatus Woesearchaeota archaeon]
MGKIKRKRPRRGSLQYWPRKRARRSHPVIRNWPKTEDSKPIGFLGYKAGMSRVILIDNRKNSPSKGEELSRPITVIETPPLKVFGIRVYKSTVNGIKCVGEIWDKKLEKDLSKKIKPPKSESKAKEIEKNLQDAYEIRLLVHTQPKLADIGKKKPEIMEIPIGGKEIKESFNYAKSVLGQEIKVSDILKEGSYLDVHAVTKGKGVQGVIKRFGVKRKRAKSEKGVRRIGTLGSWNAITWRAPHPGQMGYHQRTEKHKFLFKISNPKDQEITPKGGFVKYGAVTNDYILIDGSIPGPKKRLIVLTPSRTPPEKGITQSPELIHYSLSSQQG